MKYYVYFDAYGHARQIVSEQQLAEKYDIEPAEFLSAICREQPYADKSHTTGHAGTFRFDT